MSLESPRDLRFEGANAPEDRRPRAPNGSTDFAEIPYSTLQMCSWAQPGEAQRKLL